MPGFYGVDVLVVAVGPPSIAIVGAAAGTTSGGKAQKVSASCVATAITARARPQRVDVAPIVIAAPLIIVPWNVDDAPSVAAVAMTRRCGSPGHH